MEKEKIEIQEISEEPEMRRVLELAMEAGRILLQNGAEIFRVEETIWHICKRYEIEQMDAFVLTNAIFLSAGQKGKESFARVKDVTMAGTHLGIVTEVNNLSREIAAGKVDIDEAFARLKEIEKTPPMRKWQMALAAGVVSGSFCYLLKANVYESILTFFIGGLMYFFVLFAQKHKVSKIITNIVGAGMITVMALLTTHMHFPFPVRLDKLISGSLLPLVPGVAFVNAIRDISDNDFISGIVRMLDALLVFVYIAIGVGCVLSFYEQWIGGGIL